MRRDQEEPVSPGCGSAAAGDGEWGLALRGSGPALTRLLQGLRTPPSPLGKHPPVFGVPGCAFLWGLERGLGVRGLQARAPIPPPRPPIARFPASECGVQVPAGGGGQQRPPGAPSHLPAVWSSWVWVPGIAPWAGMREVERGEALRLQPSGAPVCLLPPGPQVGKGQPRRGGTPAKGL